MFIEKLTYTLKTEKYAKKTLLKEMNAHKQELDINKNEILKLKQEATTNEMMIAKLT